MRACVVSTQPKSDVQIYERLLCYDVREKSAEAVSYRFRKR